MRCHEGQQLPHVPNMRRRMSSGRCDFLMCSTSHCGGRRASGRFVRCSKHSVVLATLQVRCKRYTGVAARAAWPQPIPDSHSPAATGWLSSTSELASISLLTCTAGFTPSPVFAVMACTLVARPASASLPMPSASATSAAAALNECTLQLLSRA